MSKLPVQSIVIFREHFWRAVLAAKEKAPHHYDLRLDKILWDSSVFDAIENELFKKQQD